MAHAHGAALLPKPSRQPLRQIDGAMAAASTANGNGEIAFPLPLEARQERVHERAEVAKEGGEIRVGRNVCADLGIEPSLWLECRNIVRIAQETRIEDDVTDRAMPGERSSAK